MEKIIKTFLPLLAALIAFPAAAQEKVEMADAFRADGKIYVVVAIVLIVLAGLFAYLFRMDRKLKKLEDQLPGK